MRRNFIVGVLGAFMLLTGAYILIYLWRAFRVESPAELQPMILWHGDNFARALLVAVLFLIGLVVLVYISLARRQSLRAGQIQIRQDLWKWLVGKSEQTNESPSRLAERALAGYRARVEGARPP